MDSENKDKLIPENDVADSVVSEDDVTDNIAAEEPIEENAIDSVVPEDRILEDNEKNEGDAIDREGMANHVPEETRLESDVAMDLAEEIGKHAVDGSAPENEGNASREGSLRHEVLEKLLACQKVLKYSFKNIGLLAAALTHTSGASHRLVSNERLEFLGDAILGAIIVDLLYHRCESMMEGAMTQCKSAIVSRATCTRVSRELKLETFLFLGKGMNHQKVPASILANMQESIIGAIYLDGGLEAAREYILRVFSEEIEQSIEGESGQNYKMRLQQWTQKVLHMMPYYRVLEQRGPDHRKCFKVQVHVGEHQFQGAWGKNKKEAEQHAALNALCQLENQPPVYPSDY
ncbi:MAG: ribonuclease III [Planctomycetia bacterium]|nr:ribonuclease III [Planctomycetia bacterium]